MKSWPKFKLGHVGLCLNIVQNHNRKSSIQMKSWPKSKLGQGGVGSNIAKSRESYQTALTKIASKLKYELNLTFRTIQNDLSDDSTKSILVPS